MIHGGASVLSLGPRAARTLRRMRWRLAVDWSVVCALQGQRERQVAMCVRMIPLPLWLLMLMPDLFKTDIQKRTGRITR